MYTIDIVKNAENAFVVFGKITTMMLELGYSRKEADDYISKLMTMEYDTWINKVAKDFPNNVEVYE